MKAHLLNSTMSGTQIWEWGRVISSTPLNSCGPHVSRGSVQLSVVHTIVSRRMECPLSSSFCKQLERKFRNQSRRPRPEHLTGGLPYSSREHTTYVTTDDIRQQRMRLKTRLLYSTQHRRYHDLSLNYHDNFPARIRESSETSMDRYRLSHPPSRTPPVLSRFTILWKRGKCWWIPSFNFSNCSWITYVISNILVWLYQSLKSSVGIAITSHSFLASGDSLTSLVKVGQSTNREITIGVCNSILLCGHYTTMDHYTTISSELFLLYVL